MYSRVQSSMIEGVGFDLTDPASNLGTLSVTFTNGRTYDYEGVPLDEYTNLVNAGSVGKYFLANVKDQYRTK